jgi:Rrf2 family iron-sulfur cluster assembly transcriptional regulator
VNLQKSTRYALYAAMEMARAGEGVPVTAAEVADRYPVPGTVLAKIFQQLARSGVAVSTRGTGGGYQLARKPSTVTLLDVINIFEPPARPGDCLLVDGASRGCQEPAACPLRQVFDEIDELTRSTLASITLETLVGRSRPQLAGRRPE